MSDEGPYDLAWQWEQRAKALESQNQALQEQVEKLEAQRGALVRRLRFLVQEYEDLQSKLSPTQETDRG